MPQFNDDKSAAEKLRLYNDFCEALKDMPPDYDHEKQFSAFLRMIFLFCIDTEGKTYKEIQDELVIMITEIPFFQ